MSTPQQSDPLALPGANTSRRVVAWFAIFWFTVFIAGFGFAVWHARFLADDHQQEQFVALKMLQANHRIVEGDVAEAGLWHPFLLPSLTTRDDFVGRYVATCVDDQDPIEIERTLSGPKLTRKQHNAIVWISLIDLPAADIATLDVHRELDVCNIDGQEKCGTYAVEALACTGKDVGAATCSAGVQLTTDQRRRLFTAVDQAAAAAKRDADAKKTATPTPQPGAAQTLLIPTIHLAIHRDETGALPRADAGRCAVSPPAPRPQPPPSPSRAVR